MPFAKLPKAPLTVLDLPIPYQHLALDLSHCHQSLRFCTIFKMSASLLRRAEDKTDEFRAAAAEKIAPKGGAISPPAFSDIAKAANDVCSMRTMRCIGYNG